MSIRDINKRIMINNALTGELIANIDLDYYEDCEDYIKAILDDQIDSEEGVIIKVGYKS